MPRRVGWGYYKGGRDPKRKAKRVGWRKSKDGSKYYEARPNRSDWGSTQEGAKRTPGKKSYIVGSRKGKKKVTRRAAYRFPTFW